MDPYAPPLRTPRSSKKARARTKGGSVSPVPPALLAQGLLVGNIAVAATVLVHGVPAAAILVLRLATIIAVLVWVHEASTTVRYLPGVTMSPSSVVVWFFVPLVNFWMPFAALREIDRAADPRRESRAPPWIRAWQVTAVIVFIASALWRLEVLNPVLVVFAGLATIIAVIGTIRRMEPRLVRVRRKRRKERS